MQMSYVRKLLSTNTNENTRDTREEEPKAGEKRRHLFLFALHFLLLRHRFSFITRNLCTAWRARLAARLPACPARGRSLSSGQRGVCVIQMRLKVCGAFLYGERESMQRFFVSFFTDCKLIRKIVQCCVKWQTCCNLNIMIIYDLFADTIYMLFFYLLLFLLFLMLMFLYCCVELIKYTFIIYI